MKSKLNKLGNYINLINTRNKNLPLENVRGVSISKKFIKTKANMKDVDISDYKVVKPGQFSFNPNTARMGNKIPIAYNDSEKSYLVSKIYPVFEVKNKEKLIPEYLMLWFRRAEFDRYARYHSWGSARETFDWDQICEVKIPIPSIEIQQSIIIIADSLQKRKSIFEKIEGLIEDYCPIAISGILNNKYL